MGAIGAPAAAWMAVGTFGVASTGAAISGLSGAAATGATAASFGGGSVAAGGLGVAVAPFVFSGIGIVAGLGILGVAGLIARNRRIRNERDMQSAGKTLREAKHRMEVNGPRLKTLAQSARQASTRLIQATGVLLAVRDQKSVELVGDALSCASQVYSEFMKPLPHPRLYIGKPSPIKSVSSITTTKNSVTLRWKDPDRGESEIERYVIRRY